jgi:hypothetical protein
MLRAVGYGLEPAVAAMAALTPSLIRGALG